MQQIAQQGQPSFLQGNKYYLIALLVILLDQIVKLIVKFKMELYDEFRVFGDWFKITYVENKGAAFGLTIGDIFAKFGIQLSDDTSKLILSLFSIFAVIVIIYLLRSVSQQKTMLPFFMALILGGALGNIVDRVFYGAWFAGMNNYDPALLHGRVVDMFHLDLGTFRILGTSLEMLPVFNVADAAITIGIVAVLLFQRRFFRQQEAILANPAGENRTENQQKTEAKPETETAEENPQKPEQETPPGSLLQIG